MKPAALLLVVPLVLCGCNALHTVSEPAATAAPLAGPALSGSIYGGQQPVSGATVRLWSVGTTGDGSAASLLTTATTSLSNGSFDITGKYSCPSASTLVYITAAGGNPGLAAGTTNNQLSLATLLGTCGALLAGAATTPIQINELTTVAAAAAIYPYATSTTQIGYSAGNGEASAFSSAFALAAELVNPATGTSPGATAPAGYTVPTAELNTLANILAPCINSAGGSAGDSSACGQLFSYATPPSGTAPTDVVTAALDILKNPNNNVTQLFALANASAPFQPTQAVAPADWTVPLLPNGTTRILFVGDSFTHGRYSPVRNYNSANVTDENYGLPSTSARVESSTEPGPYGGIPGIFKMLTTEAGLKYDVHIEAISSTSLNTQIGVASQVIANPQWNAVVLQELSTRPISTTLTKVSSSNPAQYCSSVKTLEQSIHSANAGAGVYLYGTWARADEAYANESANTAAAFGTAIQSLTTAYHNAFYGAAANDGAIAAVVATGDAWQLALNAGYVALDPYLTSTGPFLWYGYNTAGSPANSSTNPDEYHPSIYGAYLSALVLYGQITGQDPAAFGTSETAAAALGISASLAVQLQNTAHTQVYSGSASYTTSPNPCTIS